MLAGKPRYNESRDLSICAWTLLASQPEVLIVPDLRADARCCRLLSVAQLGGSLLSAYCVPTDL